MADADKLRSFGRSVGESLTCAQSRHPRSRTRHRNRLPLILLKYFNAICEHVSPCWDPHMQKLYFETCPDVPAAILARMTAQADGQYPIVPCADWLVCDPARKTVNELAQVYVNHRHTSSEVNWVQRVILKKGRVFAFLRRILGKFQLKAELGSLTRDQKRQQVLPAHSNQSTPITICDHDLYKASL